MAQRLRATSFAAHLPGGTFGTLWPDRRNMALPADLELEPSSTGSTAPPRRALALALGGQNPGPDHVQFAFLEAARPPPRLARLRATPSISHHVACPGGDVFNARPSRAKSAGRDPVALRDSSGEAHHKIELDLPSPSQALDPRSVRDACRKAPSPSK